MRKEESADKETVPDAQPVPNAGSSKKAEKKSQQLPESDQPASHDAAKADAA
jgi:hypothetical protein